MKFLEDKNKKIGEIRGKEIDVKEALENTEDILELEKKGKSTDHVSDKKVLDEGINL